jgi:hypothetical protein
MDFRFEVQDERHGTFHLDHCGALMDVEPLGDDYVRTMCHDIEDPTFDATAAATNPRARMRPVHRPPRAPSDRHPHCAWTVTIEPEAEPLALPVTAERMAARGVAATPLPAAPDDLADDDGWNDYAAPLDPDLVMERFSSATLARILDEVALQGQLLSQGFLVEVAERWDAAQAAELGGRQLSGVAGVSAKRLAATLAVRPDLDGVARVLAVHPMFLPRTYVDVAIDSGSDEDGDHLRVALHASAAMAEADGLTWAAILVHVDDAGVRSAVQCVAPTATVERADASTGEAAAWVIRVDPGAEPVTQADEVTLTEFSTGATFAFERRGPQ